MKTMAISKADVLREGVLPPEPLWADNEDILFKLSDL